MITILVLEDENKVYQLLREALGKGGYSIFNEAESLGLIKIIKRSQQDQQESLGKRILRLNTLLLKEKSGQLYDSIITEIEKPLIESVLKETEGNQLKAAKILGINRNTLHVKLRKLGIKLSDFKT